MSWTFLGFRLAGPMSSWGDVAVGDTRSTWAAPSASALTGLLGAAHGIRREDEAGQKSLAAWRFAVRLDQQGTYMRDFHTIQSPKHEARGEPFRTRKEELEKGKLSTKVSERGYYCGQIATIMAWGGDVQMSAEALKHPAFFLALGRRACPPARPLYPVVIKENTLLDAFHAYDRLYPDIAAERPVSDEGMELYWDAGSDGPQAGINEFTQIERRDRPETRGPDWSFSVRKVNRAAWPTLP